MIYVELGQTYLQLLFCGVMVHMLCSILNLYGYLSFLVLMDT